MELDPAIIPLKGHSCVVHGKTLVVFGGVSRGKISNDIWKAEIYESLMEFKLLNTKG